MVHPNTTHDSDNPNNSNQSKVALSEGESRVLTKQARFNRDALAHGSYPQYQVELSYYMFAEDSSQDCLAAGICIYIYTSHLLSSYYLVFFLPNVFKCTSDTLIRIVSFIEPYLNTSMIYIILRYFSPLIYIYRMSAL